MRRIDETTLTSGIVHLNPADALKERVKIQLTCNECPIKHICNSRVDTNRSNEGDSVLLKVNNGSALPMETFKYWRPPFASALLALISRRLPKLTRPLEELLTFQRREIY